MWPKVYGQEFLSLWGRLGPFGATTTVGLLLNGNTLGKALCLSSKFAWNNSTGLHRALTSTLSNTPTAFQILFPNVGG